MRPEVSRLDLELLALGELAPERVEELRRRALDEPPLAERIARVQRELDEASHEMPQLVLEEEPAPAEAPSRPWWIFALPVPVLAAAVALFVLLPQGPSTTMRGQLDLELWRLRMGEAQPVGALIEAQAGDRIQYEVRASEAGWLAVYDLQEDGVVSTFLAPREVQAEELVEGAVLLDDYPGSERIYFVLSEAPLLEGELAIAAEKHWDRPLSELEQLEDLDVLAQRSVLVVRP